MIIGSVGFVIAGVLFVLYPETFLSTRYRNSTFIFVAGIAAIAFFGLCGIYGVIKLFDKKVGLKINNDGITDNSNATSVGLIEWKDIKGFETLDIASTKILIVKTDKPEKYINRATNPISKRAMQANFKMYDSPLSIISNSLEIKFDDLKELIISEFKRRK